MVSFEALMDNFISLDERAKELDRKANKNRVTQEITKLVYQGKLTPCYYNPITGRYEKLPDDMIQRIEVARTFEGSFPKELYRSMKKSMAYQVKKEGTDGIIKSATESPVEKLREKQEFVEEVRKDFEKDRRALVWGVSLVIFAALYFVVAYAGKFWPFAG